MFFKFQFCSLHAGAANRPKSISDTGNINAYRSAQIRTEVTIEFQILRPKSEKYEYCLTFPFTSCHRNKNNYTWCTEIHTWRTA